MFNLRGLLASRRSVALAVLLSMNPNDLEVDGCTLQSRELFLRKVPFTYEGNRLYQGKPYAKREDCHSVQTNTGQGPALANPAQTFNQVAEIDSQ
jgi:hypothetical protein